MTRDTIIIESNAHNGIVSTAANWTLIVGDTESGITAAPPKIEVTDAFCTEYLD